MESLNLNALAGSLPTSNLANAEKELLNNFRGIAFPFTLPYRDHPTEIDLPFLNFFFPLQKRRR